MTRIVVFANGVIHEPDRVRAILRGADAILCADGGTRHALALSVRPDIVIGDLDSLDEQSRTMLQAAGVALQSYARDKNETDLELALQEAMRRKPSSIVVVGALGKRLDQTLANLAMLRDPALDGVDVRLDDGLEEAWLCRAEAKLEGKAGDIVSLLPWGGDVEGVRTEGLKWPLRGETLRADKTRGISNEMLAQVARVSVSSGWLLIIHRRQSQAENQAA